MPQAIDKHQFLITLPCLTWGWLDRAAPRAPVGPGDAWRFHVGREVQALGRTYLGAGRFPEFAPLDAADHSTRDALGDPATTLVFEGTFRWREFVARADALRRTESGWELVEIKSSTTKDDGEPRDKDLDDVAYTTMVATKAGLAVSRVSLVVLNRAYRLGEDQPLLATVDVTEDALLRAEAFATEAPAVAAALAADGPPPGALQLACRDCPHFADVCVGRGVPDPLFVLPRLSATRFEELRPYERVSRIPADVTLTPTQTRIAQVMRDDAPYVDPKALAILDDVVWPAYYLDFETVSPPVPWFAQCAPYQATAFQYSLHVCDAAGSVAAHHAYLAPASGDWRRELVAHLLERLGTRGSIVVYSSYEKTQLRHLAEQFPDLAGPIADVIERLFDLEPVFRQGYVHPGFRGRTSIKKVLPVMTNGVGYDGLAVRDGDAASAVFALMRTGEYPAETHAAHRADLLAYCRLDTEAMVELHAAVLRVRAEA